MVASAQSAIMCVVVQVCMYGRVPVHLPRHRSDVFSVAVVRVDAVRRVAPRASRPLTACVALGIIKHLTVRVLEEGPILPVCPRSALGAPVVEARPDRLHLCGSFVAAEVPTVREKPRVVPYGCCVHIVLSHVTDVPLAKIVGMSGVCLEGLLGVCSAAMRQRLRRSPPQHRKKRGGAGGRSWRRLQLLRWGVTYSYLIKARQGAGLISCRPVCGRAKGRVATCRL